MTRSMSGGWGEVDYPQVVGHEIVGIAIKVGSKVKHVKEGDLVGVGAQNDSCRECSQCTIQREVGISPINASITPVTAMLIAP